MDVGCARTKWEIEHLSTAQINAWKLEGTWEAKAKIEVKKLIGDSIEQRLVANCIGFYSAQKEEVCTKIQCVRRFLKKRGYTYTVHPMIKKQDQFYQKIDFSGWAVDTKPFGIAEAKKLWRNQHEELQETLIKSHGRQWIEEAEKKMKQAIKQGHRNMVLRAHVTSKDIAPAIIQQDFLHKHFSRIGFTCEYGECSQLIVSGWL